MKRTADFEWDRPLGPLTARHLDGAIEGDASAADHDLPGRIQIRHLHPVTEVFGYCRAYLLEHVWLQSKDRGHRTVDFAARVRHECATAMDQAQSCLGVHRNRASHCGQLTHAVAGHGERLAAAAQTFFDCGQASETGSDNGHLGNVSRGQLF